MAKERDVLQDAASICTVVPIISTIAAWICRWLDNFILSWALFVVAAISFIIGLFFVVFPHLKKTHSYFYRWLKYTFAPRGSFVLKSRKTVYEFIDRGHMNHSKNFVVIPRVPNFDTFTDRYVYSGDRKCTVRPTLPRQRIVDTYKDHGWNFYTIKASDPATKGTEKEFGMKMDTIDDSKHSSQPFLSTGIYEKTTNLVMEVYFRNGLVPHRAKIKIFDDYVDRTPFYESHLAYDSEHERLRYELKYPIYHYRYMIEWSFEPSESDRRGRQDGRLKT